MNLINVAIRASSDEQPTIKSVPITGFIAEITASLQGPADMRQIHMEVHLPGGECKTTIDPDPARRAVINVIADALRDAHRNTVRSSSAPAQALPSPYGWEDSGPGFTKQDLREATKMPYMADSSRSGRHFGFVLAAANTNGELHGGQLIPGSRYSWAGCWSICFFGSLSGKA